MLLPNLNNNCYNFRNETLKTTEPQSPDNKKLNRSSNDRRALGLGNFWQIHDNTTNAVNLDVIMLARDYDSS